MKRALLLRLYVISACIPLGCIAFYSAAESEHLTPKQLKRELRQKYKVYDATGQFIGITTDSRNVITAFPGHEGMKFELWVGDGDEPPTIRTFNPLLFFLSANCEGEPYVRVNDYDEAGLDGVTQLQQLALLKDGRLMYGDRTTPPGPLNPVSYSNDFGVCREVSDPQLEKLDSVVPMLELEVNWELPLTVRKPNPG